MNFEKHKSRLRDYLQKKGVDISVNPTRCFNVCGHKQKDQNRALQISDSVFKCYGCGIHGDIYDAVGFLEGIKEKAAQYEFIERLFSDSVCGG
jgi:hypothetical protein